MRKNVFKILVILVLSAVVISLYIGRDSSSGNYKNSYGSVVEGSYNKSNVRMSYAEDFVELLMYKQYDSAYAKLTDDTKQKLFNDDREYFEEYVKLRWFNEDLPQKKVYYTNRSNIENDLGEKVYVYNVLISISNVEDYKMMSEVSNEQSVYFFDQKLRFTIYEKNLYDYTIRVEVVEEF